MAFCYSDERINLFFYRKKINTLRTNINYFVLLTKTLLIESYYFLHKKYADKKQYQTY